jgi:hypothetical protein
MDDRQFPIAGVVAVTFWPVGIDPREEVFGFLRLASIDAPSGLARFMLGQDGVFTDSSGNAWVGSQLIEASELELPQGRHGAGRPDGAELFPRPGRA